MNERLEQHTLCQKAGAFLWPHPSAPEWNPAIVCPLNSPVVSSISPLIYSGPPLSAGHGPCNIIPIEYR